MPDPGAPSGSYQSLYRRFRPQRFEEVLGQEHVALALRNSVRNDAVGHAYLFSGPRGTGKTSTARILAKALNCARPLDGEPCGECDSCVQIARGNSLDVHELDAASNNGVDAMRDLVARAALGTPGRWKVYIVDEVHMLSAAASNALLKTLEEPPGHVVFVMATTDPHKVLPTIRSRTQHFEFRLLGADVLETLVRSVREEAALDLPDEALAAAVRRGRGSARDTLSALDQLGAGGVVDDDLSAVSELGEALAERDPGRALVAVADAFGRGLDVGQLTGALVEHLRQGFLATVAPDLVTLAGPDRAGVEDVARRLGLPGIVRAMETLGRALVDMRDAPDPRVNLETALIRLAHPDADDSPASVLERLERLERALAEGGPRPTLAEPGPDPDPPARRPARSASGDARGGAQEASPGDARARGPELARKSLGALRREHEQPSAGNQAPERPPRRGPRAALADPGVEEAASSRSSATGQAPAPTRDELVQAWGDTLLGQLSNRARARFRVGRFLAVEGNTAVFALPNETHRTYCEEVRVEVEQMLAGHFGTAVPMRLVVDEESTPSAADRPVPGRRGPGDLPRAEAPAGTEPTRADEEELLDPEVLAAETEPAGAGLSAEQRVKQLFPGAQEL